MGDSPGTSLVSLDDQSIGSCRKNCCLESRCFAFIYNPITFHCWLLDRDFEVGYTLEGDLNMMGLLKSRGQTPVSDAADVDCAFTAEMTGDSPGSSITTSKSFGTFWLWGGYKFRFCWHFSRSLQGDVLFGI
eukprot:TRINITY_DN2585_c0_g1_i1.p2 TRINITY_DN2585_c0_g1~~TRINITY_DN2585_c0_g1_i1.p2  ORF type:complete len:151 (-),score=49.09 TRINITY_DN2585_c0_g1_i1:510-905(-)